ncbi:hypothetical protein ElyMa_000391100 [Elysia marginata]|uniref:Uncharacterized protein n=1 Tax=Elysia marginata TaxID=1093978 RepID=A0AAV4FHU5_9GAST|nr:hypothetical protein ElyMa_000391100 [Elysia marginata]
MLLYITCTSQGQTCRGDWVGVKQRHIETPRVVKKERDKTRTDETQGEYRCMQRPGEGIAAVATTNSSSTRSNNRDDDDDERMRVGQGG